MSLEEQFESGATVLRGTQEEYEQLQLRLHKNYVNQLRQSIKFTEMQRKNREAPFFQKAREAKQRIELLRQAEFQAEADEPPTEEAV